MSARAIKNPAASVRARLLNHAREHGDNHERVLTRYAIERLLYRLSLTEAARRYVLKGAMLFVTWPQQIFRPTGDLDFLGYGNSEPAAVAELFTRICCVEVPEDGMVFDPSTLKVDPVREADRYQGVRVRLTGKLDGAIIPVQVDVGFGDHVYPAPKRGTFRPILPDLPAASILMYPPETVIAEKFHAVLCYAEKNTRLKDFHDLWVIARTFSFDMAGLVEAVGGTLRRRGTDFPTEMPIGLTEAFAAIVEDRGLWKGFLRRSPPTLLPPPFAELQGELRSFFGPVIANLALPEAARGEWSPDAGRWR
jgi:hypothetical protein